MKPHPWKDGEFVVEISDLIGKVFTRVSGEIGGESLELECAEGTFEFYHSQNCCESVSIEDITGDLNDLVGHPILMAEESTNETEHPEGFKEPSYRLDSFTWTFYKLATIKGYVDIRWLGESNGYYSESVDLRFTPKT